jgi:parallel beta-helix repeat protein
LRLEALETRALLTTFTVVDTGFTGTGAATSGDLLYCLTQVNADGPGLDTIRFAIPGAGAHTIKATATLGVTHPVVMDGWSQGGPGYTGAPLVELDGSLAGGSIGLYLAATAAGSTIDGLAIDNYGGTGLRLDGANNTLVEGNYIGVTPAGGAAGNGNQGIRMTASGCTLLDNVISNNALTGVWVLGDGTGNADNNVLQGNEVGTDPTGNVAMPNGNQGVLVQGAAPGTANNNLLGGVGAGLGNIIAASTLFGPGSGHGLVVAGQASGTLVEGNDIGTNSAGANLGNAGDGVLLVGASGITIGGTAPGAGNIIAFNAGGVVVVGNNSTGDSILGNSIHDNLGPGIDLGDDGVTPNNTSPPGPNDFQNYPVLSSASGGLAIGFLPGGTASTSYRIEFFASPAASSARQGETYLGFVVVNGNGGNTAFSAAISAFPAGWVVTATATDLGNGDTSEFSAPVSITPPTVIVPGPGVVLLTTGHAMVRNGLFSASGPDTFTAVVDYGDGSGPMLLALAANHSFTLAHVYASEGNFQVKVHVIDSEGVEGSTSFLVATYISGIDLRQVSVAFAAPGQSVTVSAPGITAALFRSERDTGPGGLLVVPVPVAVARGLGASPPGGTTTVGAAYDVRGINLTDSDTAVVVFAFPGGGVGLPVLHYFDPARDALLPVHGSSLAPATPRIDRANRLITVVFDRTSQPALTGLTGTVFTVSVTLPVAEISPAAAPQSSAIQDAAEVAFMELNALQASSTGSGTSGTATGEVTSTAGEAASSPTSSSVSGGRVATAAPGSQVGGGADLDERRADDRDVFPDLPPVQPLHRGGGGGASLLLSPSQASFPSFFGPPPPSKEKPTAPGPRAESRSPRRPPELGDQQRQVEELLSRQVADERTALPSEDLDQTAGEEAVGYLLSSALVLTGGDIVVRRRRRGTWWYPAEQVPRH